MVDDNEASHVDKPVVLSVFLSVLLRFLHTEVKQSVNLYSTLAKDL